MKKLLILLVQVVAITSEYEVRCPVSGEWRFRYRKFNCSRQNYVCLQISPGNIYNETCDGPDYISAGSKLIFQPIFFNKVGCKYDRYQPFLFSTNETSDCVFGKSICNEEGQILFNQGSVRNDIACGCNFSTGFRFVTKPKNNCFCIPSEEDCSCYKPTCYSIDNQCHYDDIDATNTSCSVITTKPFPKNDESTPVSQNGFNETQYIMDNHIKGISNRIKPINCSLALLIIMIVTIFVCVFMAKTLTITVTAEKEQIDTNYGNIVELTYKVTKGCVCFVKSVDWYRNDDRIECFRNPTKYTLHGKSPILTIKGVDSGDLGDYRCVLNTVFTKYESENVSLVKKIPREMQTVDSSERQKCMEAIKSGQEVRRYVRIQVIGKHGVGKSSLVRRLLNEEVHDVKSTDGIDIVKKCHIRASDGKWIIGEGETERKKMIRRFQEAVHMEQRRTQSISDETKQPLVDIGSFQNGQKTMPSTDVSLKIESEQNDSIRIQDEKLSKVVNAVRHVPLIKDVTTHAHNISGAINTISERRKLNIEGTATSDVNALDIGYKKTDIIRFDEMNNSNRPLHQNTKSMFSKLTDEITKKIFEEMDKVIVEVKKKSKQMTSDDLIECGIWDFAGQKDYYVTHQTFLTPNAIYLIVANLKEDIKAMKHDENFDSIEEYIDFWFDSIHCLCEDSTADKLNPPVILVFTHTDECEKVKERKTEFLEKIQEIIGCQLKGNHKRSVHFISNKIVIEEDINKLKDNISEIAREMEYFTEVLPTDWIQLENAIAVLKDLNINILSWDNIEELGRKVLINDKEQLIAFLTYQHKIGNIIFFKDISECIILQPNWLIKCFRCLICDDDPEKTNIDSLPNIDWRLLTSTGELSEKIIDHLFQKEPDLEFEKYKHHILNVMEKFDIIIKPRLLGTESNECLLSNTHFMPCMIRKPHTTLKIMRTIFGGDDTDFSTSPWLILEFGFLPPAYFNHILFNFIRKYTICEEENGQKGIYGGKAVFYLDDTKFRKLIICFSKNAVSLQIWKWGKIDDDIYRKVLEELCFKIQELYRKLNHHTTYKIKAKCSTGDYSKRLGRISIEELNTRSECGEYFCEEHRKKHKREDIENTWLKHAGIVSCMQTGNFQLLSEMSNGSACKRMKQNFCSLKQTLLSSDIDTVIEEIYGENILAYDIYKTIKNLHNLDQKVEYIIKRISETDEDRCVKFQKLLTCLNLNTEPGKAIPEEKRHRYQSVTKVGLRKRLEEMKDQLEIKNTLGWMLEYDVITVRDHDDIQRCKRLKEKVEAFINCVFQKEHVDWIPKFLYVLELRGYSGLADALSGYKPILPVQGNSFSTEQSVRLDMRVALPEDAKRCLLENNGHLLGKAVQGVLQSPILNLRQEPIYFFHNISKDTLFVIRQNATRTLSSLVNKMLHSTKVKGSIAEKTFVLVEIDETEADTFFNQNFGYIEKTIIMKYDSVFNEIETDIIVNTLKEEEKAPDFFQYKSIDIVDSLSRIEKIGLFLQFVLSRESILEKIMHLLNDPKKDVERPMDSPWSGIPVKSLPVGLPKNRTLEFQVHEHRHGHLIVELILKDSTNEDKVQQHEPRVLYLRKEIPANKDMQLVAVIDIGASYSGYAYSTVDAYRADHLDITCNQSCKSGRKQKLSSKTPCCILMKKNKELVSTGNDAVNDYVEMIEDGKEDDYLFFEQFKLSLHTTTVSPEKMVIEDIKGNQIAAIDVFAAAIKALKNDLEQHLSETYTWYNLSNGNIKWVLILPGLWTVSGKELMRKSAEKIGIRGDKLSFVREPDAASLYYLNKAQRQRNLGDFTSDNKFMIINIGGGSFAVSAYERIQFNQLRRLCSPSGGLYGGTTVNTYFLKMLTEIVGEDVMQSLKREHTVSYLELNRKIEDAKRDMLRHINTKRMSFTFPMTIFNDLCYRLKKRNFEQLIEGSKYKNSITITDEKIWILRKTMYLFFSSIIREIETEIRRVFRTVEGIEKTKMLLVGGFADSEIVRDSIAESFPKNELVFSEKSDLIVLMGAVSHGYQPHVHEKIPTS